MIRNAENVKFYEQEFEKALENRDIKNIALTGPYGSGKSSIIKTFFYRHPQYNPLYVSLAAFKDERTDQASSLADDSINKTKSKQAVKELSSTEQKILNDSIEYSILQQLFYHVRPKEVPFSRLKRIRTLPKINVLTLAMLITIYSFCILYCYRKTWLPSYDSWKKWDEARPLLAWIAAGGVVLGTFQVVLLIIKYWKSASMIKLNLDKAQVEIAPDKGSSVLNQHMDEIVYYFGATRYDLLVIEDLDRFKNPEIFVKLREINTLINNSLQINRKVTFIYALRDDVFTDESRTKFFDVILPVVPVINATNSASDLIEKFEELKLLKPIAHNFLNDLSLFITDRRLIQNILNEFVVYSHQLNNPELKTEVLLSLIVYKNIHPTDFSDLQSNKGMVYDLFENKQQMVQQLIKEKEEYCRSLENRIEATRTTHLKTGRELRLLYLAIYYKMIYARNREFLGNVFLSDQKYNLFDAMDEQTFNSLRTQTRISISVQHYSTPSQVNVRFSEIEADLGYDKSYELRLEEINDLYDNRIVEFQAELKKNKSEINKLKGVSVREILYHKSLSEFDTPIKEHKLLTYLISNGYISEEYRYYLSYFQPGELSENDYRFILSVKNRKALKWDHQLNKVTVVAQRMNDSDYMVAAIMNLDLLNYIISCQVEVDPRLNGIVLQLSSLNDEHWFFIEAFKRKYSQTVGILMRELVDECSDLLRFLFDERLIDDQDLFEYVQLIIQYGRIEGILRQSHYNWLKEYIATTVELLEHSDSVYIKNIQSLITNFNVKFTSPPNRGAADVSLVKHIYDNNHYIIRPDIIDDMIQVRCKVKSWDVSTFNKGQYKNIVKSEDKLIIDYIQNNMEEYLTEVFIKIPEHDAESSESMTTILENNNVSDDTKLQVIQNVPFHIEDISLVSTKWRDLLLHYNRITISWNNIVKYRDTEGFSPALRSFINKEQVYKKLSEQENTFVIPDMEEEKVRAMKKQLLETIFESEDITQLVKNELIRVVEEKLEIHDFSYISSELLRTIIGQDKLGLNKEVLIALKQIHFKEFILVTITNWEYTSPLLGLLNIGAQEYQALLAQSDLNTEQREVIYESMPPATLRQAIKNGQFVPRNILAKPTFHMTKDELQELTGKVTAPETVTGLIEGNINIVDEDIVIKFLLPLGDVYERIAKRKGKKVNLKSHLPELLTVLQDAELLIEKFTVKNKIIEIAYIENKTEDAE